jgi:hypothetical protein
MSVIRGVLIVAVLCIFVGIVGTTYIWLESSSVATDEYTHAWKIHFKSRGGGDYVSEVYLSDKQDSSYKTLNALQDGGIWGVIGIVVVLGVMKFANKDRGSA